MLLVQYNKSRTVSETTNLDNGYAWMQAKIILLNIIFFCLPWNFLQFFIYFLFFYFFKFKFIFTEAEKCFFCLNFKNVICIAYSLRWANNHVEKKFHRWFWRCVAFKKTWTFMEMENDWRGNERKIYLLLVKNNFVMN